MAVAAVMALALLASCGGGGTGDVASSTGSSGDSGGVGSGGTGSYTSGTISGLGSIIVNGVRYSVNGAHIEDDAGNVLTDTNGLGLGMTVEVSGSAAVPSAVAGGLATASATVVRYASALVAPIEQGPDSACSCLIAQGQKVTYTATTVMPSQLRRGDVIEVYGRANLGDRALAASRIDVVTDGRSLKLAGFVPATGGLDTTAKTISVYGPSNPPTLGGAAPLVLHYSRADQVSALSALAEHGLPVRVWFDAQGQLQRLAVDQPLVSDRDEARVEGRVTATSRSERRVAISGSWVDASALDDATLDKLQVGVEVLAEGRLVKGTLVVSHVHLDGEDDDEEDGAEGGLQLHGKPENPQAIGSNQGTMVLRGVTVLFNLSASPSMAQLNVLQCVEAHGSGFDSQGRLVATQVEADDSCH